MAHQTHYEVHVKQNGRWEIHGRHTQADKEQAIEEAKALDGQKHIQAVKVIQEIYDPEDGSSKEYNVYAPGQKKYQPPRKKSKTEKAKEVDAEEARAVVERRKKKQAKSGRSLTTILMTIALISGFSTVVGAMFTFFTSMFLADTDIGSNAQSNILFIVFLSVFVIAAIPMAMVFLGKSDDDD
jgi:cation transport ATPase